MKEKIKKLLILSFMALSVYLAMIISYVYSYFSNKKKNDRHTILVVRLDRTVGDTVMNSVFLKDLRRLYPDSNIILVVHKNAGPLVSNSNCFDELYFYNPGDYLRKSLINRLYKTFCFTLKNISCIPDLSIVPRYDEDHNAAFISLYSLAYRRVGYSEKVTDRKCLLNYKFDSLFTDVLFNVEVRHEVERGSDLLYYLTNTSVPDALHLDIWLTDAERASAVQQLFHVKERSNELFVCLGFSSGYSKLKQWPLAYFGELVHNISLVRPNISVVLLGIENDRAQCEQLKSILNDNINIIDFVGMMTLRESAAIISNCHLYIGNDSGNMHLAASVGIPVIGIFGSSCFHRFSPWGENCSYVSVNKECGPCMQGHKIDRCSVCIHNEVLCMKELTPDIVMDKVKAYL